MEHLPTRWSPRICRVLASGIIAAAAILPLSAQSSLENRQQQEFRTLQRALMENRMTGADQARRRAEQIAAKEERRRLLEKMLAFARNWNAFVQEYGENGTFNIKKAKEVTKAFNGLQREDLWPRGKQE